MNAALRPCLASLLRPGVAYLSLTAALIGCASGTGNGGYNPTTPQNTYDEATVAAAGIKTVVITSVNLGSPSRNYLKREEDRVDDMIADRLRSAGYKVLPKRQFAQRWNNAVLTFGNPVDPTTGRVNTNSFVQIMQTVRNQMLEQTDVDAFLFTDLLERRDVTFTQGVQRVARWDGVSRKPSLAGPGQGVSAEFDWGQPISTASIRLVLFNRELEKIFEGRGGIDTTDAVDTRSGIAFVRRKDILENNNFIEEGISIAFHPWLPMTNWPGTPPAP